MKITSKLRKSAAAVFLLYLLILVWVIMLKCNMETPVMISRNFFAAMTNEERAEWSFGHFRFNGDGSIFTTDAIEDILVNIVLFIPIGVLLPFIFKKNRYPLTILYSFLITLVFELSQFIFSIGGFAYIDLITNTVGGMLGGLIFYAFSRKERGKAATHILRVASCILLCILGFSAVSTLINIKLYLPI